MKSQYPEKAYTVRYSQIGQPSSYQCNFNQATTRCRSQTLVTEMRHVHYHCTTSDLLEFRQHFDSLKTLLNRIKSVVTTGISEVKTYTTVRYLHDVKI